MKIKLKNSQLRTKQAQLVYQALAHEYKHAKIALNYSNPWELFVAVVLSAQCTDKMVNTVTNRLFKKYTKLSDYVNAETKEFEKDIQSTGFFRTKAKNILESARIVETKYNGMLPKSMIELLKLPGVARKSANVILSNAFSIVEGVAVDTHVLRISQRLRLVDTNTIGKGKNVQFEHKGRTIIDYKKGVSAEKVEKQLMTIFKKSQWFHLTYYIIEHGRKVCKARNPNCSECALSRMCPVSRIYN